MNLFGQVFVDKFLLWALLVTLSWQKKVGISAGPANSSEKIGVGGVLGVKEDKEARLKTDVLTK